jgi:lysyl-tRNA synthetase class 2
VGDDGGFSGGLKITHPNGKTINLTRPWRRVSMADLVEAGTGWKFDKKNLFSQQTTKLFDQPAEAYAKNIEYLAEKAPSIHSAKLIDLRPEQQLVELYEKLIEPTLIDPTFVTHVPSVIIPLAKKNAADPYFADVYELAINGQEISPGYSELNDPDVQAANFAHQVGDEAEKQKTDDDFLNALRYGMPPAGGLGLGIDRLLMMLTGAESIRDVILFPLMKPQG